MCDECFFGCEDPDDSQKNAVCPSCGCKVSKLFPRQTPRSVSCIPKASNKEFNGPIDVRAEDIEINFENMKFMGDHVRTILNEIDKPRKSSQDQIAKLSFIVDSGAGGNGLDPRDLHGYPLMGIPESKQQSTCFTASGGPIPDLGKNEASVCKEGGSPEIFRHAVHYRVQAVSICQTDDRGWAFRWVL